ncbi:hypothetical protein HZH68_011617 [Vespula germanica]|uniref:Uncharacterized protein n=1 Tax=Vespula germanica TaxID=30212 RepID=A0A834N1Z2_VESGE|nr:hypothetical protein HZH68_011617 [Vespula germanica]
MEGFHWCWFSRKVPTLSGPSPTSTLLGKYSSGSNGPFYECQQSNRDQALWFVPYPRVLAKRIPSLSRRTVTSREWDHRNCDVRGAISTVAGDQTKHYCSLRFLRRAVKCGSLCSETKGNLSEN